MNSKMLVLFLGLIALIGCTKTMKADFVVSNVNIIDVETGKVNNAMDILIVNHKIDSILPHDNNRKYDATKLIDYSGKYILPGLWDMHVHLSMIGEESIPLFVLNGVTGVRDMGGNWPELKAWRSKGNSSEETRFPKIKTAGPILESPRFYGLYEQILGPDYVEDRIAIDTENQAYAVVDSLHKVGVDFIKVRTVKSQEIFKAISEACAKHNLPFTGHIDQNIGIEFAVEQNIKSIEHDVFFQALKANEKEVTDILVAIKQSKTFFSPTLLATNQYRLRPKSELIDLLNDTLNQKSTYRKYLSPTLIEQWNIQFAIQALEQPLQWDSLITPLRSFAEKIAENSVVISGTDCGVTGIIPGAGLHDELRLLVEELGLNPLDAVKSSTINAVEILGLQDEYGLIKPGYYADLLILNENPLKDITQTSNIYSVLRNGAVIDQNDIEQGFEQIADKVEQSRKTYENNTLNYLNTVLKQMSTSSR